MSGADERGTVSPASSYHASSYDHYACLKPPLLLWVAVLYLSRGLTLPAAMALGHLSGVDPRAIEAFRGLWSPQSLAPSLIAAVILYVLCRRVPTAPRWVRWVWSRGRAFLAGAAVLDIALLARELIRPGEIDDASLLSSCAALVDVYLLLYILAARRVRDTFREFPAADQSISPRRFPGRS
jgi:hypothetical protein